MRCAVIIAMLIAFPPRAWGQWVTFEACGRVLLGGNSRMDTRAQTGVAPHVGPYVIWPSPGLVILGFTEKVDSNLDCSEIRLQGQRIMVVGSVEEVVRKLCQTGCVKP